MNKLLLTDMGGDSYYDEDFVIASDSKFAASEYTNGQFINALYCQSCAIGFIPDALLKTLASRETP